ncbi:MAG TPA: hypothetical protein VNT75_29630, partial [Symbiobacteriaceae bacterium]|nr:hypothetical protein [Symbiobacteriaceae bacterium]
MHCRRRSYHRFIATVTVLAALLFSLQPAAAAPAPAPELISFSLPATAQAGTTLRITAVAQEKTYGVESGSLTLKGPSGQRLTGILVRKPRTDNLVLDLPLPAQLQPGRWFVEELVIRSNESASLRVKDGQTLGKTVFSYSVQITAGGAPDLSQAVVQELSISPAAVEQGAKVTVSVKLSEPPSGAATVTAYLGDTRSDQSYKWAQPVPLLYNPTSKRWEGATYAPVLATSTGPATFWIRSILTRSGTGVERWSWCGPFSSPLPGACTFQVVPPKVTPALTTSRYLELFHPGKLDFFEWHNRDMEYLRSLFARLDTAPESMRMLLAAQLPALTQALGAIRGEIYRDPSSGIRVAVPNTSGKHLVVTAAVRGRLMLWGELERRAGGSGKTALTAAALETAQALIDEFEVKPVPPEVYDGAGAILTQRYIEAVKASQIPPGLWNLAHANDWDQPDTISLTPNVQWMIPFSSEQFLGWHSSSTSSGVRMTMPKSLPAAIWPDVIIHELGHHFHDVFLGGQGNDRSSKWQDYLTMRGGQEWYTRAQTGHNGQPWENLAEDFSKILHESNVYTDAFDPYQYPLMTTTAEQATFRKFLLDLAAQKPPTALELDWPLDGLAAVLPGEVAVTGRWAPAQKVSAVASPLQVEHFLGQSVSGRVIGEPAAASNGAWKTVLPADGPALQAVSVYGQLDKTSNQRRHFYIYRSGLLLDAVPFQVSSDKVALTGRTVPGAKVTAN